MAMLTGLAISRVCRESGKWGCMYPAEMHIYLAFKGHRMGTIYGIGLGTPVPRLAIIFLTDMRKEHSAGHVALWEDGVIYDPEFGIQPDYPDWLRPSWFAEIEKIMK